MNPQSEQWYNPESITEIPLTGSPYLPQRYSPIAIKIELMLTRKRKINPPVDDINRARAGTVKEPAQAPESPTQQT